MSLAGLLARQQQQGLDWVVDWVVEDPIVFFSPDDLHNSISQNFDPIASPILAAGFAGLVVAGLGTLGLKWQSPSRMVI
jgi:hypothetical protein